LEAEAQQDLKSAKCTAIRNIWAKGLQVQKRVSYLTIIPGRVKTLCKPQHFRLHSMSFSMLMLYCLRYSSYGWEHDTDHREYVILWR